MEGNRENFDLIGAFFRGLKPTKRLTVSQWADENRVLSDRAASEPGRWRTDRTPYLREIMDSLSSFKGYQTISVMKGAQLGFTEVGLNWIGYVIDNDPSSMLMVMPTDSTLKRNVKNRINPMLEDTPCLARRFPASAKKSENTLDEKLFDGGVLFMAGANSPAGLRSMPIARVFLDEVDAYPRNLDGEGSPIELARARTRTFARRKIFMISTPTIQGASVIESEFQASDQRHFHVPCPHCGSFQDLKWEQIRWDVNKNGTPTRAWYECEHCHAEIKETAKPTMLANGRWIAHAPEHTNDETIGFHINSLYSPLGWYSWLDAAQEYVKALKDEEKMITFRNTVLGLPYATKSETVSWEILMNRRENYKLNLPPSEVVFITAGVDVQRDRIELEIVGWGRGRKSWSLDYRVLEGDTAGDAVWERLALIVRSETWQRADGVIMPLMMTAIDTGYNAQKVYEFVRRFDSSRVVAVKGNARADMMLSTPSRVDVSINGQRVGDCALWSIGVDFFKGALYGALRQHKNEHGHAPDDYCYFPQSGVYGENYFRGLTAEQLQEVKTNKGFIKHQWVKTYRRNEPLDCRVYATAAAAIVGMYQFNDQHYSNLERSYTPAPPKREKKKTSDFWD